MLSKTHRITRINFWANQDPSTSAVHYDLYDNFLLVLKGEKTVFVKATNTFSETKYLKKLVLRQGEVLRIPEGVYHRVESSSGTLAVNFWMNAHLAPFLANFKGYIGALNNFVIQDFQRKLCQQSFEEFRGIRSSF